MLILTEKRRVLDFLAGLTGLLVTLARACRRPAPVRPALAVRRPTLSDGDTRTVVYDAATLVGMALPTGDITIFTYDRETSDLLAMRRG